MEASSDRIRVGVIGAGREDVLGALRGSAGIDPVPTSDIDAAGMVLEGELSYVIGVCESGGGAALAIPIAVLGATSCTNLSKLGRPIAEEALPGLLAQGYRAFGVARDHVNDVVPALAAAIESHGTPSRD
jgi:Protein of unknown function DUF2620